MNALFRVFLGAALLAGGGTVRADEESLGLETARRQLEAGNAQQAVELLEADLLRYAGNTQFDYLLGTALHRSGQLGPALFAFERVLMVDPANVSARLKAAEISAARGDGTYAAELLRPLEGQGLNGADQQAVERVRAEIAANARRLSIRGYVAAGVGWDDNVTSGPDKRELILPKLSSSAVTIGTAAKDGDLASYLEGGVSLRQAVADDLWLTGSGNIRQGVNSSRKDIQEGMVNMDVGLQWRVGGDYMGITWLGQDYLVNEVMYRRTRGGRGNWWHPVGDQTRLNSYLQFVDFQYPGHPMDNARRGIGGLSFDSTFAGGARMVQYGIYGGEEVAKDAGRPHFSYWLWGATLGAGMMVSDRLSLSIAGIHEQRRHQSEDALYFATRQDRQTSVGISLQYRLADQLHLIPQYTHTRNASNTALYDYTRNTLMLQLRWDFDNEKH